MEDMNRKSVVFEIPYRNADGFGGGSERRQQLLQAIARIEEQLQNLRQEVEDVKALVEQLND